MTIAICGGASESHPIALADGAAAEVVALPVVLDVLVLDAVTAAGCAGADLYAGVCVPNSAPSHPLLAAPGWPCPL